MQVQEKTTEVNLIRFAVGVGVLFWFLESWIDTLFIDEPYLVRLLQADSNEIWMRSFIIVTIICFAVYAQRAIGKIKLTEEARRESEKRFRIIFEQGTDSIVLVDAVTGALAEFNDKAVETLGYTREKFQTLKVADFEIVEAEEDAKKYREMILKGESATYETKLRTKDGRILDILKSSRTLSIQGREYILYLYHDITERKRAEDNRRLAVSVFESAAEGITVTDANRNILTVNPAFTEITGYTPEEIVGKNPRILASGKHDAAFYKEMWDTIHAKGRWSGEIWERRKNGEIFPEWLTVTSIKDDKGKVVRYTGLFNDITKQKLNEEDMYYRAHYDQLTGLANRLLFSERLSQAMKHSKRKNKILALMFIDLDRFKNVNDTFGHSLGDYLLKEAGNRFQACVKEDDSVARSGGDEFLILLPNINDKEDAEAVAKEIIEQSSLPFRLKGHDAFVSASIGITMFPADGDDVTTMLKNSDMAMYQAKDAGRNTYKFFNRSMTAIARERATIEWDLRMALERNELEIYYQPIIDIETKQMSGTEALLRWNHPKRGLVYPDKFIPIAEQSELIVQIGEWVLLSACRQLEKWHNQYPLEIYMAVNMSTRQFNYKTFTRMLTDSLKRSGLAPNLLTLEITESLLMDGGKDAVDKLGSFREMGIHLSIDDFGTGYSSLSYLSRFPIDLLKIDKSFVHNVATDPTKQDLVKAIITMAHALNLKVIAEGVEIESELVFLRDEGCDSAQGYYFSRPLMVDQFEDMMNKGLTPYGHFQIATPLAP
ncbi:MAG: EAL domain-containing protein [Nitrospira sp.]